MGHYRKGNVDLQAGTVFIVAGIFGAFAGAGITSILTGKQLKVSFGVYALLIAINLVYTTWKKKKEEARKIVAESSKLKQLGKGSFFGLSAGLIAGTFGTSGTAPVLAGLFSMRLPVKIVIGTSLVVVLANTLFALGAHFMVGRFDLTVVGFLTFGSVAGAMLGTHFISKAKVDKKENNIRYVYALVMAVIGILMMISK